MTLVAGIDSSTQSCKVLICDAATGEVVREGTAAHPDGTEIAPAAWEAAAREAIAAAGGLDGVEAVAVGAQQHGMVCLDGAGRVVRPALLWNDVRSADAARALIDELGGPRAWAQAVGVVPLAAITVAKLRWLADHEPQHADRTAAVCLPHDWLTWRLRGDTDIAALTTDRSDASGTGYYDAASGAYRFDLLELAMRGRRPHLPTVLGPSERTAAGRQSRSARASGTTPPRRWASAPTRATSSSRSGRRVWWPRSPPTRSATTPALSRDSPTAPGATSRWCARSTARGCWTRPRQCCGSTTTSCRNSRCRRRRAARGWSWCPTWRASEPPTGPTPLARCTAYG